MLWPALFVYSISIRLKSGPLKHLTGIFLSVRGGKKENTNTVQFQTLFSKLGKQYVFPAPV